MARILDIIVKYWVTWVCGLLAGFLTFLFKKFKKFMEEYHRLQEKDRQSGRDVLLAEVKKEISAGYEQSKEDDAVLQQEIDILQEEMDCLKGGVLSIQGAAFKMECRRVLNNAHEITLDEWEEIDAAHEVYNKLGGNHKGDQLYELVKAKATVRLSSNHH